MTGLAFWVSGAFSACALLRYSAGEYAFATIDISVSTALLVLACAMQSRARR